MTTTTRRRTRCQTTRSMLALAVTLTLAGTVMSLAGCSVFRTHEAAVEGGVEYPTDLTRGEVVDVQVFRDNTRLRMTNTTTRDFGPGTVWINQRFSHPVDGFAPGERLNLDLYQFEDQFGADFRGGGFFATRDPDAVVLVEYAPDGADALTGFILVLNEMN